MLGTAVPAPADMGLSLDDKVKIKTAEVKWKLF
jgi:hypothetical protein